MQSLLLSVKCDRLKITTNRNSDRTTIIIRPPDFVIELNIEIVNAKKDQEITLYNKAEVLILKIKLLRFGYKGSILQNGN